jgi:hypothetical protein
MATLSLAFLPIIELEMRGIHPREFSTEVLNLNGVSTKQT